MRRFLALAAVCASGQTFHIEPSTAKQGDVIRVSAAAPATSARMLTRTIRLFPQAGGGGNLGLMPVAADQQPGKLRLEILGANGTVLNAADVTVADAHFPEQNVKLEPRIEALRAAPGEIETVTAFRNTVSDVRHWQEPFARPVAGCMSSPFGVKRLHNGKPTGNYHGGIDQRSPAGQPIHVIAAGVVRMVREFNLHGSIVGVDHGQGLTSTYLHMSKFAVAEGGVVKRGDIAGYVGSTGRSTGPHLHWGVTVNGVAVNPAQWLQLTPCGAASKPKARRATHRKKA
jgi:murein DD-endopeptidase MepM/ murein hydrolase activator NlpD